MSQGQRVRGTSAEGGVRTPGVREPVHPRPPTPVDEKQPRQRSNLALRIVTAGMLIPPITFAIFEGGFWVLGAVVLITLVGIQEFYHLIEAKGAHPLRTFGVTAAVALPFVVYWGGQSAATVLMSMVLLGVMVLQLGKAQIGEALASISGTFFGVFYVGWLLSHVIVLRDIQGVIGRRYGEAAAAGMDPAAGAFYLFFTIAVVIGGDVGAYFAGRAWGRRQLAPKVSPNKTVEGALGAIAFGTFVGLVLKGGFDALAPAYSATMSWTFCALVAPVLAGVGIVGDLVESLLKRDAQVKDTGTLLPGTGGVLDRIDSNLLAIPVMYYVLLAYAFLVGGFRAPGV